MCAHLASRDDVQSKGLPLFLLRCHGLVGQARALTLLALFLLLNGER
jgi:hypothetical protein